MWSVTSLLWSSSIFARRATALVPGWSVRANAAVAILIACGCASKKPAPAPPQNYPQQPPPNYPQQPPQNYPPQYGAAPAQPAQGTFPAQQVPPVQHQLPQPQQSQPVAPGWTVPGTTSQLPSIPGIAQAVQFPDTNPQLLGALAQSVLAELIQALPAAAQGQVRSIPLLIDDRPGEVNAFAACDEAGQSAMAITVGLLKISATLSTAQAHDNRFGTRTVDAYIETLARQLRSGQAVPGAAPSLFPGLGDTVVQQQRLQLLEEQVAFILGHELGHHHLNHLPCTAAPDPSGVDRAGRVLSNAVPLFNQPNEVAADLAGVGNVLDAGRRRQQGGRSAWTEGGALLSMRFFSGLSQLSAGAVLTSFERSHPLPQLRTPILTHAASNWRRTGSVTGGLPFGGFGFNFQQQPGATVDNRP